MAQQDELITRWRQIQQAGGITGWIQSQLEEQGFAVSRQSTDGMSQRELDQYKKQLREESAARKRLKKEAWQAYRATHLVFLGENVYWNDDVSEPDRWDIRKAEERAAENELPRIDKPQQLADMLELSISGITLVHLSSRGSHAHSLCAIYYSETRWHRTSHLGAIAKIKRGSTLDSDEHC